MVGWFVLRVISKTWSHMEKKKRELARVKMISWEKGMTVGTKFKLRGRVAKKRDSLRSNPGSAPYELWDFRQVT